jgi:hypothetical protein
MDKVSFREILFLLKMSRDLQTLLAAITHLVEGLSLETFFTLKVGKSLICFAGIIIIIQYNSLLIYMLTQQPKDQL